MRRFAPTFVTFFTGAALSAAAFFLLRHGAPARVGNSDFEAS